MFWQALRKANLARVTEWHPTGVKEWTAEQWATAILGEIGEAANALKKTWRGDGKKDDVAYELADVIIYCDLLLATTSEDPLDVKPRIMYNDSDVPRMLLECAYEVRLTLYKEQSEMRCSAIAQRAANCIAALGYRPVEVVATKFNQTSDRKFSDVYLAFPSMWPVRYYGKTAREIGGTRRWTNQRVRGMIVDDPV